MNESEELKVLFEKLQSNLGKKSKDMDKTELAITGLKLQQILEKDSLIIPDDLWLIINQEHRPFFLSAGVGMLFLMLQGEK